MDKALSRQGLCKLFSRLKTIGYITQLETYPLQAGMFKSNGGGNQRFIGDFRAIDLPGSGASQAMGGWISTANIILPAGLLQTGRTAEKQYQLRLGSQPARRRGHPASALHPTSLFYLHSCLLSIRLTLISVPHEHF